MLRGDREAMQLFRDGGATEPAPVTGPGPVTGPEAGGDGISQVSDLGSSVRALRVGLTVADLAASVRWYRSIGFELVDLHEHGGVADFAMLSFGSARIGLSPGGRGGPGVPEGFGMWFEVDRIHELHRFLEQRRLEAMRSDAEAVEVRFVEDLYQPFYGGWQFSVRDPTASR